jgi:hypothetical protein
MNGPVTGQPAGEIYFHLIKKKKKKEEEEEEGKEEEEEKGEAG